MKTLILITLCSIVFALETRAQQKSPDAQIKKQAPGASPTPKKTNQRPTAAAQLKNAASEPFDKATVEAMAAQCVKLETEAGAIELEMFPESAPESVRNFLNLAATGAFDTTIFNRVVPGFVVQGGDLFARSGKMTAALDRRARRKLPDEPSLIKHERGIVSMARLTEPNSATTSFFILVNDAAYLDGTFAAFGRVTRGMEVVDAVNKMPVVSEKPVKPVRITRATASRCEAPAQPKL